MAEPEPTSLPLVEAARRIMAECWPDQQEVINRLKAEEAERGLAPIDTMRALHVALHERREQQELEDAVGTITAGWDQIEARTTYQERQEILAESSEMVTEILERGWKIEDLIRDAARVLRGEPIDQQGDKKER